MSTDPAHPHIFSFMTVRHNPLKISFMLYSELASGLPSGKVPILGNGQNFVH